MKNFLRRNSSTILTCIGAFGLVATTVMAVKATPKALTLIDEAEEEKGEKLTKFEIIKETAVVYAPTVVMGAATLACIFGSNVINKRQQASLMSAYALLDQSFKDYRAKVTELYGEEAGGRIREEIAKDKYTGDDAPLDDNNELFYDFYSGRYFESTREAVLLAAYNTNRKLFIDGEVGINDFYEFLGLGTRREYDSFGWTCGFLEETYWASWIEFDLTDTVIDDSDDHEGMTCTIVHMPYEPCINYLEL